jgi:hypothetical protein
MAIIRFGRHFFALAEYVWIVARTRYLGFVISSMLYYATKYKQETTTKEVKVLENCWKQDLAETGIDDPS